MNFTEIDILNEKAKSKKDGVYSFKGNVYAVKDGKFIAYADLHGDCFHRSGAFNVHIGRVPRYERTRKLKQWLKEQTK